MTTIAATKTAIACDRQFTHQGTKFKGATKCFVVPTPVAKELFGSEKVIVGGCGSATGLGKAWEWLSNPEGRPKISNCEFLMVSDHGIHISENLVNWIPVDQPYYAIGSGTHFAQAILSTGGTPKDAIACASKHDPMTGMGIKEYRL